MTASHMRDTDGCIFVYDITDRQSYDHISDWMNTLQLTSGDDVIRYLVGNKLDLIENQENTALVGKSEAINFCRLHNLDGVAECSALNNINIDNMFMSMCTSLYKKNNLLLEERMNKKSGNIRNINIINNNQEKFCCI
jgi:GTPase SAR1 family protein